MKKIFMMMSLALLPGVLASAQTLEAQTYPNGIYIFCGKDLPRNFYYLIEKQDASGAWVGAAELHAPQNAAALKANLLRLPDFFAATMSLPIDMSERLWRQISQSQTADSLYAYLADPKIVAAAGCGWFDDGVAAGEHRYRVSKVYRTDAIPLGEISRRFPENNYQGTLNTIRFVPEDSHVMLWYGLSDSLNTGGVILYRSRLMENNYRPTPAITTYALFNGRTVAVLRDESVTKGMAYSYVAVPRDALGNMGTPSDTVHVYNLANMADIGMATDFTATGDKEKRGVTLSWNFTTDFYIQGFDLYRSKEFDDGYTRIASLPSGTMTYFDGNVEPSEIYFYSISVNNGFGVNMPSVRAPVILEGDKKNFMPPQDLEAELHGNVVHLTFGSIDADTWGYQIFRGEGFTGELSQIASISVAHQPAEGSDERPVMLFTDTLALTPMPQTYSYAVADVNSSYNVSPLSERVSVQYSGGMMPTASNVEALLRDDRILVVWDDAAKLHPYIGGYQLWRSTVTGDTESEAQLIATLPYEQNNYVDTLIAPATHYRYAVETIGVNGESGGRSLHAGITVPQQLPLPPGQVSALASDNRILLRWDNPLDPSIQSIRIYRAIANVQAALLKELPASQTAYEDTTAKQGEQYYYYVVTVNRRGEESKADEPVSARIRK